MLSEIYTFLYADDSALVALGWDNEPLRDALADDGTWLTIASSST